MKFTLLHLETGPRREREPALAITPSAPPGDRYHISGLSLEDVQREILARDGGSEPVEAAAPAEDTVSQAEAAGRAYVREQCLLALEDGITDQDRELRLNFAGGALMALATAFGLAPAPLRDEMMKREVGTVETPYDHLRTVPVKPERPKPHPGAPRPVPPEVLAREAAEREAAEAADGPAPEA